MKPDVVVSTGPPHSAHLVAWLATLGLQTRWIMDLRDPWAGPITGAWRKAASYRSYVARWVIKWLERVAIGKASGVLCNTREFAAAIKVRHPDVVVDWLPNGVDAGLLPQAAEPLPGLGLVHLGTIYGGRDLRPVLRALRVFPDRHPEEAAHGPALRIAGALDDPVSRDAFRSEVTRLGLTDQVAELGVLSRDGALHLAARARLALVLAQGQELQVPGKLYELVAIGVPTLVLAGPDDAASSEARRIGAKTVEPDDCEAMVQIMESACRGPVARSAPNGASVDYREIALGLGPILMPVGSNGADHGPLRQ
jgi:glycosyltransferase involved in cell wall biosynthesis